MSLDIQSQKVLQRLDHPLWLTISLWIWNAVLNRRSVPSKSNNDQQNLVVKCGSWSDIMTFGRPCSWKTWSTKIWAYSMVVTSFLHLMRCTIFVNLFIKAIMAVNPFDSSKSVMRSMVTSAHFHEGISSGCSNPAFALLSYFIIWHMGQVFTYWLVLPQSPCQWNCQSTISKVLHIPTCPVKGTLWHSFNIFCCKDLGMMIFYQPPIILTIRPDGVR